MQIMIPNFSNKSKLNVRIQNNDDLDCDIDIKDEELSIKLEDTEIFRKILKEAPANFEDRTNGGIGKVNYKTYFLHT